MKKKLALLMAAIMTVAMVPMTAFASTKLDVFDMPIVGEDGEFDTIVELVKDNIQTNVQGSDYWLVEKGEYTDDGEHFDNANHFVARPTFQVKLTLTNAEFTLADEDAELYEIEELYDTPEERLATGVVDVTVQNSKVAIVTLDAATFNQSNMDGFRGPAADIEAETTPTMVAPLADACVLQIEATGLEADVDVVADFKRFSGRGFTDAHAVIAKVTTGTVEVESEGVVTFVEDSDDIKELKDIMIEGLANGAISDGTPITLKLSGDFSFAISDTENGTGHGYENYGGENSYSLVNERGVEIEASSIVDTINNSVEVGICVVDDEEIILIPRRVATNNVVDIILSGIYLRADKNCSAGDVATLRVTSRDFKADKFEIARMVEEAVTYTVEDDDLPRLWAGQNPANNDDNDGESLSIFIEENTGDILNTSRKATFTFPEGIEVVSINYDGVDDATGLDYEFEYEIDENVVSIWDYGEDNESNATDMEISFVLSAAPTFSGDVDVTLGGEFDDVELTVATVKAPYTVEAKTSEVLIDYRYVPVNNIVITEAEEGLLEDGDVITLQVEKMDFEDAGSFDVTSGDIDVDVTVEHGVDDRAQLAIEVKDESTEASTITISGLELYLDRTLPVGGYALENVDDGVTTDNILWENSTTVKVDDAAADDLAYDYAPNKNNASNGLFKYSAVTVNDSYVEVVTAARDQDDSTTTRKIVITIGATTMAVGTDTVTLDTPAYINAENYTELPLRAVSEAFGATVGWDDASRTVTIMMGQRIVSMTIGSKTMYINGTPVAMNTAPKITNERTFVPVRDLANALGITKIDWNEASATVTLN